MKPQFLKLAILTLTLAIGVPAIAVPAKNSAPENRVPANNGNANNGNAKMFKFSSTIEKERPELSDETRRLIAEFRKNPNEANRAALRRQLEANYDRVVERKKAKLAELKTNARERSKVDEMQEIVDEMLRERDARIEQNLRRFADPRMLPGARENRDGFLPILGAKTQVFIAYQPVTNAEFAEFVKATKSRAPKSWKNGKFPSGNDNFPVTDVSFDDAKKYCDWLTKNARGNATFRLPTEEEWELAAGHMPKDIEMNSGGERTGMSAVDAFAGTLSAVGAIDMWGNVWEWTSTPRGGNGKALAVKGGAWDSPRTACRTENRAESRERSRGFANVGFRIVRESQER